MKNFEGVLTHLDCESNSAPAGARGRKVIVTSACAHAALGTLVGAPINCSPDLSRHAHENVCGRITDVRVDRKKAVRVRGIVDETKIPTRKYRSLGMSFELTDAHITDMRTSVWEINKLTFTGAAILLKEKAAYRTTEFRIKRGKPCPTILQSLKAELEKIPKSEALAAGKK